MSESLASQLATLVLQMAAPIALGIIIWFVQRHVKQQDDQLKDLRGEVKELRDRDDKIKDGLAQKVDDIKDRMDEKLEAMRDDLNGGLNAIREQLARIKA